MNPSVYPEQKRLLENAVGKLVKKDGIVRNAKIKSERERKMLSKSEREVMELLWKCRAPLTCAEIVEYSENKDWKDSYIHSIVRSLLKKKMITVSSFGLNNRSYARCFTPISRAEYGLREAYEDDLSEENIKDMIMCCIFTMLSPNKAEKIVFDIYEEFTSL